MLFSLLFCPLVRNILAIIIGAHQTRPPHHPAAAAAPAGVGATSGSKAFGPSLGPKAFEPDVEVLAAAAAATALPRRRLRVCARPNEGSWKYEKVQEGRE